MSWHFSRALVEEYWQDIDSDGAQFVQSRSSHTQLAFCSHDKMTEFSRPSLSGMTFAHLTENLGRELLTWFLEGFPAKTSALLDSEKDSVEEGADSGVKWRELFVRYHPDSSSWKTHQCLWNEVLLESSLTLPKWGMMLDGVLYQLLIPTHITRGRESGYSLQDPPYPTPCASDAKGSGKFPCKAGRDRLDYAIEQGKTKFTTYHHGEEGTGKLNPDWVEWLMGLPVGWTKIDSLSKEEFQRWENSQSVEWYENDFGIKKTTESCETRAPRIKALGNAQVPFTATLAIKLLKNTNHEKM